MLRLRHFSRRQQSKSGIGPWILGKRKRGGVGKTTKPRDGGYYLVTTPGGLSSLQILCKDWEAGGRQRTRKHLRQGYFGLGLGEYSFNFTYTGRGDIFPWSRRWLCPITYTTIWEIGVFSLKIKLIYQGKWLKPQIVGGAEIMDYFPAAQRRGNKYYFVASKDDCGCCSCRSAAKSSVICRTSSRQLQIRYDQQRDKLFPPTSTLNILSLLVADIMVLTLR